MLVFVRCIHCFLFVIYCTRTQHREKKEKFLFVHSMLVCCFQCTLSLFTTSFFEMLEQSSQIHNTTNKKRTRKKNIEQKKQTMKQAKTENYKITNGFSF